jgi:hypothetical protein
LLAVVELPQLLQVVVVLVDFFSLQLKHCQNQMFTH